MTRVSLLLGTFLFSLTTLAQGVDLEVTINGDDASARGAVGLGVSARWNASIAPQNVVLELDVDGEVGINEWDATDCTPGRPIRCTIEPRTSVDGGFYAYTRFPGAGTYTATARITSSTPDPNPANNVATKTVTVGALPQLRPYGSPILPEGYAIDPGGAAQLAVGVQNDGELATNVIVRAFLPEDAYFTAPDSWSSRACTIVSPTEAMCHFGAVSFGGLTYSLGFVAPDRHDGGTFTYRVTADADQDDFKPADDVFEGSVLLRRLLAVTNANDEGAGSLRQAMLESRETCVTDPCLIGVRAEGQLVIQPRTALPVLRGRVKVDGGPAKAIVDGSLLPAGDGVVFEDGCEFRVNSIVVQNFKGHGIEGRQFPSQQGVYPCGHERVLFTPMFITNSVVTRNERGVVSKGISATISDNVIHENSRAGVFADGGYYTDVVRNVIVHNGATGVFLRPGNGAASYLPPGAEVINNFVHDNGEWGIARAAQGAVLIARNSIKGNRLYGIDYGLDLRTPDAPHKPEVLSATYDAARNATIIRVRFEPKGPAYSWTLQVYASDSLSVLGYPEAERPIADSFRTGEVELVVPGDLRGQWITATGTRTVEVLFLRDEKVTANATSRYSAYDTSELSDAVQVQ